MPEKDTYRRFEIHSRKMIVVFNSTGPASELAIPNCNLFSVTLTELYSIQTSHHIPNSTQEHINGSPTCQYQQTTQLRSRFLVTTVLRWLQGW